MVKYPDVKAECEYDAWTKWGEKQPLAIQGGNAVGVMQINWNWIISYSGNGTNFASPGDYNRVLDLAQFDQDSLEQRRAGDRLMAVPVMMTGRLFYWNKTIFDGIGYDIPVDEASFLETETKFKTFNEGYYPLAMIEYDCAIFMVYYLKNIRGEPRVENGRLRYTAEEIQSTMNFMTKLEGARVIPTITTLQGDMADSLGKNARVINGQYTGVSEWDSAATKVRRTIVESTDEPGQKLAIGDFIKLGDCNNGFTKISMVLTVSTNSTRPREAAMPVDCLLNDEEGTEIYGTERGIPCSAQRMAMFKDKGIGDALVMEADEKVLGYSRFLLGPMFKYNSLEANPGGVHCKVFDKLSADDINSAEAVENLVKGIDDCYNY